MNASERKVACSCCRQRKRRCDGLHPQCTACRERDVECVYGETPPPRTHRRDSSGSAAVSEAILKRLESIETRLGEHTEAIGVLKQQHGDDQDAEGRGTHVRMGVTGLMPTPLPDFFGERAETRNDLSLTPDETPMPHSTWALSTQNGGGSSRRGVDDGEVPPITIPLGHQTSTSSLLSLPQMRSLVGDYPEEFIFRVEDSRPRSTAMDFMTAPLPHTGEKDHDVIERAVADNYLHSFLAVVHTCHPLFDRDDLLANYEDVMSRGLGSDNMSATFLAIFALGAMVSDPVDHSGKGNSGDIMLKKALRILVASWTVSFSGDILLSRGLILCALYFTYVVEPLTAWRLIHMASTSIQQLLIRCKDILSSQAEIQELTRLSWACFIIECDLLAEYHQPRSGIDVLVDRMPFPNYGMTPKLEHLYVLAEISIRSLINRIHHAIYFTDSLAIYAGRALDSLTSSRSASIPPNPHASLLRVCNELNFQLETWYDALPADIKPDLFLSTPGNKQACLLRLRYWSAKQGIFRPFVIYATAPQFEEGGTELPASVLSQSKWCLAACRAYLQGAEYLLKERTPYTNSALQFCVNCFLVLALAANSSQLGHLVVDVDDWHKELVKLLKPWARPGTSVESGLEIANSVARKLRVRDRKVSIFGTTKASGSAMSD